MELVMDTLVDSLGMCMPWVWLEAKLFEKVMVPIVTLGTSRNSVALPPVRPFKILVFSIITLDPLPCNTILPNELSISDLELLAITSFK